MCVLACELTFNVCSTRACDVMCYPCGGAADAQLSAACTASPGLRRLDFSRSGSHIISPVIRGAQLTTVIGTECAYLSDEAVSTVCDEAPVLTTLMLALCTALVSPRIHGERLAELNLSGCRLLQVTLLQATAAPPRFHICMVSPLTREACDPCFPG